MSDTKNDFLAREAENTDRESDEVRRGQTYSVTPALPMFAGSGEHDKATAYLLRLELAREREEKAVRLLREFGDTAVKDERLMRILIGAFTDIFLAE